MRKKTSRRRIVFLLSINFCVCLLVSHPSVWREVDENLIRRDLTAAQRAKLIAKRKAAYEAVPPETRKVATDDLIPNWDFEA